MIAFSEKPPISHHKNMFAVANAITKTLWVDNEVTKFWQRIPGLEGYDVLILAYAIAKHTNHHTKAAKLRAKRIYDAKSQFL